MPCRVERNIDHILLLLADAGVRATFFTLGWIAERYPEMIRRIVDGGHELASHGYEHCRATEQGYGAIPGRHPSRQGGARGHVGLPRSRAIARRAFRSGRATSGRSSASPRPAIATARASTRSGTITTARRTRRASRTKCRQGLLEVPIATVRIAARRTGPRAAAAISGCCPIGVSRWSLRRINAVDRQPAMFYFHPWELDPEQPRVQGPGRKARFRHYLNLDAHGVRACGGCSPTSDGIASTACSWRARTDGRPRPSRTSTRDARAHVACARSSPATPRAWDAFVDRCPDATFFHRIGWRDDHRERLPPSYALSPRRARRRDRRRAAARRGSKPPVRPRAGLAAVLRLRRPGGERCRRRARA